MDAGAFSAQQHTFVVRIWWEAGLTGPGGRPLWRGRVQHVPSRHCLAFQCLDELNRFLQAHTGDLEEGPATSRREEPGAVPS